MRIEILDEALEDLIEGELIRVHAVLDCRRNPSWIRKRLEKDG